MLKTNTKSHTISQSKQQPFTQSLQLSLLLLLAFASSTVADENVSTCCVKEAVEYQCDPGFSCCGCNQCCSLTEFCSGSTCVSYLLVIFGPLAVIFFFAAIILNIKMNRKEEQFKNDLKKLENPDLVQQNEGNNPNSPLGQKKEEEKQLIEEDEDEEEIDGDNSEKPTPKVFATSSDAINNVHSQKEIEEPLLLAGNKQLSGEVTKTYTMYKGNQGKFKDDPIDKTIDLFKKD